MIMKIKIFLLGFVLAFSVPAWASLYESGLLTGGVIPDNNTIGLTETLNLSASGQDPAISDVTLSFTLENGASSDLSGYLRLGNTDSSPSYDLTSLIQGTAEVPGGTSYSIDFSTTGFLAAFNGQNPNDTWTLFFADTEPGDQTMLNGWNLNIMAVPEPTNFALSVFGGLLAIFAMGRFIWRRQFGP
jgi:subtilisin-like proprotein convertase family protein